MCSAPPRCLSPRVNLLRPSLVLFGLALAVACMGVVFYNVGLASLAVGLLHPQPGASRTRVSVSAKAGQRRAQPQRLPVRQALVGYDIDDRQRQQTRRRKLGRTAPALRRARSPG